ncbi:S-layer homology domain-containing protein [Paenibacillus sp. CGMCC 1.18879]|uniref:DUF7948 domain-containing protein n=1 Tax=Paenibacillus sp. CGMCC 1.18879 TaxID=2834466 RepID=UPI001CA897EF|nr:S-layer homology domain-containing protein [Paenibacillus sp. CGMCC 1.18879]MBY9081477.1 S-layer homology domain-containing protein [Paenibacillus sp. CGMCC 1.18879]
MKKRSVLAVGLLFFLLLNTAFGPFQMSAYVSAEEAGSTVQGNNVNLSSEQQEALDKLPIPFIKNVGQISNGQVEYYTDTFAGRVFISDNGLTYNLTSTQEDKGGWALSETFAGGRPLQIKGLSPSSTQMNAFMGSGPNDWFKNIQGFNTVSLGEVFDQIEVTLRAYGSNVEKVFTVAPGGDPSLIAVQLQGADGISVNPERQLLIHTGLGEVKLTAPVAYQEIDGQRVDVPVKYRVDGDRYGFTVGSYDKTYPLIIDPLLAATFLGGSNEEILYDIAVDSVGAVYVTGYSTSTNFPSKLGFQPLLAGEKDIIVAKFNSSLTHLIASTFLGGSGSDTGRNIKLLNGDVYIAGTTASTDIPHNAGEPPESGKTKIYVARFNGALNELKDSGIIDQSENVTYSDLAVADNGGEPEVFIAGTTSNAGLATPGTVQSQIPSSKAGIIFKLDGSLNKSEATYLGGNAKSGTAFELNSLDVTPDGRIVAAGSATSGFSSANNGGFTLSDGAYDSTVAGTGADGYIAILNNSLTEVTAGTFVGVNGTTTAQKRSVESIVDVQYVTDGDGEDYVYAVGSGQTYAAGDFTTGVAIPSDADSIFIIKLSADLKTKSAMTVFNGNSYEAPHKMTIDSSHNLYVSGYTTSSDLPVDGQMSYQPSYSNGENGFIAKFDHNLNNTRTTYFGAANVLFPTTLVAGDNGTLYVSSSITDLPPFSVPSRGYQTSMNSGASYEGLIVKLDSDTLFAAGADAEPPEWNTGEVTATDIAPAGLTLHWPEASDNSGIDEYLIYSRNVTLGEDVYRLLGSVSGSINTYQVSGMIPGDTYAFQVEAVDKAGNWTTTPVYSDPIAIPDSFAPVWPAGSALSAAYTDSYDHLRLTWPAAEDNGTVIGYKLLKDGLNVTGAVYDYSVTDAVYYSDIYNLKSDTEYTFKVEAIDDEANWGLDGPEVKVRTQKAPDTTPPLWPGTDRPSIIYTSLNSTLVTWPTASDDEGVVQYRVYVNNLTNPSASYEAVVDGQTFNYAITLSGNDHYIFSVSATDAAGNTSSLLKYDTEMFAQTAPFGSGAGNGSGGGSVPNPFIVSETLSSTYQMYNSLTELSTPVSTFGMSVEDAVDVPLMPTIKVFFYNNVAGKVETNKQYFKLYEIREGEQFEVPVEVTASSNFDERRYLFVTPAEPLKLNTKYKLFVGKEVTSNNSHTLGYDKEVYFTTTSISTDKVVTIPGGKAAYIAIGSETPDGTVVTIPSGAANSALDLSPLVDHSGQEPVARNLPGIDLRTTVADLNPGSPVLVTLPHGISLTGGAGWNGQFLAPILIDPADTGVVLPSDAADDAVIHSVVEIGSREVPLTADRAVRVVFPGQKGLKVGYFRDGVFTKIDHPMSTDSQSEGDALPAGGDGVITVGSDLVVWTKHFTQFVLYGDASWTPSIAPTWNEGSLTASDVDTTGAKLTWSGAVDDSGVAEYRIYRNGELLASTTVTEATYTVSGLSPATTYTFKVEAVDAEGLESSDGPTVSVTTLGDSSNEGGGGTGTGNGDGSGTGTGNGDGSGTGTGNGDGSGTGTGNGDGSGTGTGNGDGSGTGTGNGDGSGTGTGNGDGSGTSTGNGDGSGTGTGSSGGGGGSLISSVTSETSTEGVFTADDAWLKSALKNTASAQLIIDLDGTAAKNGNKTVSITAETFAKIKAAGKPLMIKDSGLEWIIPAGGLPNGQALKLNVGILDVNQLSSAADTAGKSAYRLSASADGVELATVGADALMRFPLPDGTPDADKLAVYTRNSSGSGWTYAGGRQTGGKLVLKTGNTGVFLVAESTRTFTDITNHWARRSIEIMAARNIIDGVGSGQFAPNQTITRAEFAALLSRTLGLEAGSLNTFKDVATNAWYAEDVAKAASAGIIKGDGTSFRPNDVITRQEMAVMIMRALQRAGVATPVSNPAAFTDLSDVQPWAKSAVEDVYSLGIIQGRTDGSFGPADSATRAEGAAMLLKLMDRLEL